MPVELLAGRGGRLGGDDVDPGHHVRPLQLRGGLELAPVGRDRRRAGRPGRNARRTRRAAREPPPAWRRRATIPGCRAGHASPFRGRRPRPGSGVSIAEVALQLEHVLRERRRPTAGRGGARTSCSGPSPGARPRPRSIRPGYIASRVPNCSAMVSGRVVGQHDAAGPQPDRPRSARRRARSARSSPTRRCRRCCGARRTRPAGSRAPPPAARAPRWRRSCRRRSRRA